MTGSAEDDSAMILLDDILIGLRFFSRLPVPATRRETRLGAGGLAVAAPLVPVAGLVIGLFPAGTLLIATLLGLAPSLAPLAVAVAVAVTGALHEDALADCADGFGGGATRERKLEIMRDSRIGAYGACAIGLSLILRSSALAILGARDVGLAAMVLLATAALSRALCLLPLVLLPPARADGNGVAARPTRRHVAMAVGLGVAAFALPLAAGASVPRAATTIAFAFAGAFAVRALARWQIGGQTGDVAGATQQVVEIVALVSFSAS